ncbi:MULTISPECIES: hypothetical protein [Streptomyces]|uniref:hypothetical protein n=1 Tax=Streptomyces TaxID=1883 RepID=UPI0011B072AB|nr:hypothetical protein [Streptomyces sp. SM13]
MQLCRPGGPALESAHAGCVCCTDCSGYRPRKVDPPTTSLLLPGALPQVDFADAFQVPLHPAMPSGPEPWRQAFLTPSPSQWWWAA